jgi:hypothetical protein
MIGVEGVDAVLLGSDVENVVRALAGDFDVGAGREVASLESGTRV